MPIFPITSSYNISKILRTPDPLPHFLCEMFMVYD